MKKDFDATLVRAACNLLSGIPKLWLEGNERERVIQKAVQTARDTAAEVERTTRTYEHPEPDTTKQYVIEIDAEHTMALEDLMALGGIRTKKELLNNALTLLTWAAKEKVSGQIIVSMNEKDDTYKEIEMPFLERVAGKKDE